jgi:carboxypeptidase family protein
MCATKQAFNASKTAEGQMRRVLAATVAVLLMCAATSFAQEKKKKGEETTRSVAGVVTAADESPVAGAVVQLKNTKTLQIRSFITKDNGAYYFHELSPDVDYELKADYQGASSGTKTLSSFDSRKNATINLKLNAKK